MGTRKFETTVPARWWRKTIATGRHLCSQLIVGSALFLIAQHVVGLVDLAHTLLRVRLLADVGMVLARKLAVGLAHILLGGIARHIQYLVVVFEFHELGVRMVEYTPGYLADHWCEKGHILLCLAGALHTELKDGRVFDLTPGTSYQVADGAEPHRSSTVLGATLFIVD